MVWIINTVQIGAMILALFAIGFGIFAALKNRLKFAWINVAILLANLGIILACEYTKLLLPSQ